MTNPIPRLRSRRIGRVVQLNNLLAQQEDQLDMLYRHLGQSVYERRADAAETFHILSAQIDVERQNLRALRERLAFAKGLQICQVCGTEQSCDHLYCAQCGHCFCCREQCGASEKSNPSKESDNKKGNFYRGDRDPLLHHDEAAHRQMMDDRSGLPRYAYEPCSRGMDDPHRAEEARSDELPEKRTPKATSPEIGQEPLPPKA